MPVALVTVTEAQKHRAIQPLHLEGHDTLQSDIEQNGMA